MKAISICVLALSLLAQAREIPAAPCVAGPKEAPGCGVSARELRTAQKHFDRGLKHSSAGRLGEAFAAFDDAARLVPRHVEFLTAREVARQQLVYEHLQRGNSMMQAGQKVEALAQFRHALELDPGNAFALQRLQDALPALPSTPRSLQIVEESELIEVQPRPGVRDFHYRGSVRGLWQVVTTAFGLRPVYDQSVPSRAVRFDLERADFATAMAAAERVTKTFWVPLTTNQAFIASTTTDNRNRFERMGLRTFYLSDTTTPQELDEVVTTLRTIFEFRFVQRNVNSNTITVRAPQALLAAATRFLENYSSGRPQVVCEVKVFQVSHNLLRALGMDLPLQFQMFNLGAEALDLLQNTNIQDLINQLIASGGINQANSTALSALLAQLQNQQNSVFSQPFATFGGGSTLMAIGVPPGSAQFSRNQSEITALQHLTLRASHGNAATMHLGVRYPLINATFSPIFNSPALAQVIQNQSFQAPFPSFTFEDIGTSVKLTPFVQGDSVHMQLEMQIRSLGPQVFNGLPNISSREYKGVITLKDGEAAVLAGSLSRSEQHSMSGIPGLSKVPGLSLLTSRRSTDTIEDELLLVITPHIVSATDRPFTEIFLP